LQILYTIKIETVNIKEAMNMLQKSLTLLFNDYFSEIRFAPAYDIVTTKYFLKLIPV